MDADSQLLDVCNEILKRIREVPENKKCFDCSDTSSPRYICSDFSTFVCSCCANIHKELGREIKCMNLFGFTLNEILLLRDSGNKLAAYRWLAKWKPVDFPEPDPTSQDYKEYAREYMKAKYIEKRWVDEKKAILSDNSSATPDDSSQLHDNKPASPLTLRAASLTASNPFIATSPLSPYLVSPSRMSFPPSNGDQPSVSLDLQQYNKSTQSFPPSQTSPSKIRPVSGSYNPFIDELEQDQSVYKDLPRSHTMKEVKNVASDDDDVFRPTVRMRSASAHALLHSESERSFAHHFVVLPSGKELKLPPRPSKALPPTPVENKTTLPEDPCVSPKKEVTSPSLSAVKELLESKHFPKSPLKLNSLVKVISMKLNSPNAESGPTSPNTSTTTPTTIPTTTSLNEGESQMATEHSSPAVEHKSTKVQGIMNKMAGSIGGLLPKRSTVVKN